MVSRAIIGYIGGRSKRTASTHGEQHCASVGTDIPGSWAGEVRGFQATTVITRPCPASDNTYYVSCDFASKTDYDPKIRLTDGVAGRETQIEHLMSFATLIRGFDI